MPDFSRAHEEYAFVSLALALERVFPDAPPIGATTAHDKERVRFRANPTLGFPPSEIATVGPIAADDRPVDVVVNLIGLFGPSSPLPAHITERVIHAENAGLRDFLDFFNHRLTSLLFLIWKRYRHAFQYEGGARDPISEAISALFGRYGVGDTANAALPSQSLLSLTGLLALGSRSASITATTLSALIGVPCRLEEFIATPFRIPEDDRLHLGQTGLELGRNTLLGEWATSVAGHFRLRFGPLETQAFLDLLPGSTGYARMEAVLGLMLNDPLSWSVSYDLAPHAATDFTLGASCLGWTTIFPPEAGQAFSIEITP